MGERKPLLHQLRDTVRFFSERKTLGRMKTEHSIFIPSELMLHQSEETEEFIKASREINNNPNFNCPVVAEKHTGKLSGVEFVFQVSSDPGFSSIITELDSRL
jgi:hypothetical protein